MQGSNVKEKKNCENKKTKKESVDEEEPDLNAMDWWSKYFASTESMSKVSI